ncbi:hypothetical protein NUW58_g5297 [Xylaria curta]|uniref:Uncharacterized protein n=1 Tax=Xylaria curta TaxID=42375 RepID=A0ACC1P2R6_9PEZI|nr:hypothetical protein NUW58_g5297 [Xylaria curta]
MLIKIPRRASKLCRSFALLTTSIISLFILFDFWQARNLIAAPNSRSVHPPPVCPKSPLLDDVLVVIRTGATEVLVKLPIHFRTVLTCVPDFVIYSDLEEDVEGHHIIDVLDQINDKYRSTAPEFWLYNKLRATGRKSLNYQTSFGSGPAGALDNPGWKLDKWKFLPMLNRSLQHRPNAKWFVFIEPDTYLIWQNVLEYLERFDSSKPHYIGTGMYIGDVLFAHGGSGFIISNPAMKTVLDYWKEHQDWFDQYTAKEWAGDMVLGRAMKEAGISLSSASPHLQGNSLTGMDWTVNKLNKPTWCYAPLTFHHMTKPDFQIMWQFEEAWVRHKERTATLRFRDVFKNIVQPQLQSERRKWDNTPTGTEYSDEAFAKLSEEDRKALSETERKAQVSFDYCRAVCENKPSCIQFSYAPRKCIISNELRVGHAVESQCLEYSHVAGNCIKTEDETQDVAPNKELSVKSGWVMTRVLQSVEQMDQAYGPTYIQTNGREAFAIEGDIVKY